MTKKKKYHAPRHCNQPHKLKDGKPVRHECWVFPTEALHAEARGDRAKAEEIYSTWKKRRLYKGG